MAETARARDSQREDQWITYLIRDPRYLDKRGNEGMPLYVGQTNDFPQRVLSRFMKCEKIAVDKGHDCVERRVANLLHLAVVPKYQVLEYQPTRLRSLVSETNWARRCWIAGYDIANRAELQKDAGPPIGPRDIPRSWLAKFSVAEAIADGVQITIGCASCGEDLSLPLTALPELAKPTITIGQLAKVWRAEECTFCRSVGLRRVRMRVADDVRQHQG